MVSEADFFTAIRREPDNLDLKLIYADWLDEIGDERGELMRINMELQRAIDDEKLLSLVQSGRYDDLVFRRGDILDAMPERWYVVHLIFDGSTWGSGRSRVEDWACVLAESKRDAEQFAAKNNSYVIERRQYLPYVQGVAELISEAIPY